MPRKILYVITRAEHGGAQVHVSQLIEGFRGRYESFLAVGEEGFLADRARELGAEVTILPDLVHPISPGKDMGALFSISRYIKEIEPDLVHAHSSKAGLLGRLAAKLRGVPSVFTAHGWAFTDGVSKKQKAIAIPLERFAGKLASKIITVSEYDKRLAMKYKVVPEEKIKAVWNGVPDTEWRSNNVDGAPRLVMVARFSEQKDHATLLSALGGMKDWEWTLDLIGGGPGLDEVRAMSRELGIGHRVNFLGALEPDQVEKLLSNSSIFVLSSRWEGLPLVIIEAMRAELPVVATDVGGVSEAVIDGETGYLIAPGDAGGLRSRLKKLMDSQDLRRKMGKAGRARYEKYFTVERMLRETAKVYEGVFAQNSTI